MKILKLCGKKLVSVIALIMMTQMSMSAAYSLVIHRVDDSEEGFLLQNKPVVTFNETDLLVTVDDNVVSIPRDQIANIDFIDEYNGVDLAQMGDDVVEFVDANTIRIKTASAVKVYDIAGRAIAPTSVATGGGEYTTVSLAQCPAGIYVISYSNKSFKIIKK